MDHWSDLTRAHDKKNVLILNTLVTL
jgi:hypothetical protein